jgi:hypothetical protein
MVSRFKSWCHFRLEMRLNIMAGSISRAKLFTSGWPGSGGREEGRRKTRRGRRKRRGRRRRKEEKTKEDRRDTDKINPSRAYLPPLVTYFF